MTPRHGRSVYTSTKDLNCQASRCMLCQPFDSLSLAYVVSWCVVRLWGCERVLCCPFQVKSAGVELASYSSNRDWLYQTEMLLQTKQWKARSITQRRAFVAGFALLCSVDVSTRVGLLDYSLKTKHNELDGIRSSNSVVGSLVTLVLLCFSVFWMSLCVRIISFHLNSSSSSTVGREQLLLANSSKLIASYFTGYFLELAWKRWWFSLEFLVLLKHRLVSKNLCRVLIFCLYRL